MYPVLGSLICACETDQLGELLICLSWTQLLLHMLYMATIYGHYTAFEALKIIETSGRGNSGTLK